MVTLTIFRDIGLALTTASGTVRALTPPRALTINPSIHLSQGRNRRPQICGRFRRRVVRLVVLVQILGNRLLLRLKERFHP